MWHKTLMICFHLGPSSILCYALLHVRNVSFSSVCHSSPPGSFGSALFKFYRWIRVHSDHMHEPHVYSFSFGLKMQQTSFQANSHRGCCWTLCWELEHNFLYGHKGTKWLVVKVLVPHIAAASQVRDINLKGNCVENIVIVWFLAHCCQKQVVYKLATYIPLYE